MDPPDNFCSASVDKDKLSKGVTKLANDLRFTAEVARPWQIDRASGNIAQVGQTNCRKVNVFAALLDVFCLIFSDLRSS